MRSSRSNSFFEDVNFQDDPFEFLSSQSEIFKNHIQFVALASLDKPAFLYIPRDLNDLLFTELESDSISFNPCIQATNNEADSLPK